MCKLLRKIIIPTTLICLFMLMHVSASASNVTVKAKLDSVQLLMGNISMLNVEVVADKGVKGEFPILKNKNELGVVSLLNDSVELRGISSSDTIDLGSGRVQMNFKIPVQSFDSGMYRLPPIQYVVANDTFSSNQVALKVLPVKVADDAEIEGYMPVAEPLNPSIFDHVPDFVIDYWWLILLILLLIAIVVYVILMKKKNRPILGRKERVLTPYEIAVNSMSRLRQQKLWEQGMEKEYFTVLTEILRKYLEGRFGVNAMEMTSREIIQTLAQNPETKDKREYVRQILDVADFVKFAKMRPLTSDSIQSFENAMRFIEETKPVIVVEETESDDKKGKEGDK